jgi:hypothetical protein
MGGNPCLEQTLEPYELCCLVETFPFNHTSLEDYKITLEYAFLYAKTVTLGKTHWPKANQVMLRNRRIGCSMSGIAQFISVRGLSEFKDWCTQGYEAIQKIDQKYHVLFIRTILQADTTLGYLNGLRFQSRLRRRLLNLVELFHCLPEVRFLFSYATMTMKLFSSNTWYALS